MLQTVSIAGFLPFIEWTVTGNDMSGLGTKEEVNALVERSGSLNKGQNAIKIQEKKPTHQRNVNACHLYCEL